MIFDDTIAAISSGLTESGIGIIRISGPDSYRVIDRIFRNKKGGHVDLSKPNTVHYGFITRETGNGTEKSSAVDNTAYIDTGKKSDTGKENSVDNEKEKKNESKNVSRETLDEVLVINMRAPHTYTGEDTIEIDCHGGVLMMKRILAVVIGSGARLAEPGEFTKRAFLNGRIDLSQAEAVIDIINAKNDNAIKASVSQLKGSVSSKISELRKIIINDTAFIEAALDDPEHYSLEGFSEELTQHVNQIIAEIDKLTDGYSRGRLIKDGINTVILGKPNAGKSSLLNAVLGEERAIVTQIPGTTRDTINESFSIGNVTLNLMDTAGIRSTDDPVEKIGVDRALKSAEEADLILCVVDMSVPLGSTDNNIFESIAKLSAKKLIVFNKSDAERAFDIDKLLNEMPEDMKNYVVISAKNSDGIEKLYDYIDNLFTRGEINYNDEIVISSLRHVSLLKSAAESLNEVIYSIENGMPEDMYTIDLMNAYRYLGEICGEDVGEDLINEIFSKFCMGK